MAQPTDNAFGAPTEGLGQSVTFVPQDSNPQGVSLGNESAQVNAGVRGGQFENRTSTLAVQVPDSPLMNAVAKLGNQAVQKGMAEARLKNYTAGLLSVGTEKGIKDIADNMPWYTYLMGGSDVLEGMRVATAEKSMADWAGRVYEDLPTMAKTMSRAEAEQYLHNGVKSLFTGDQATDSYIVQAAAKHLPTLATAFTKLEYKHNQEQGAKMFGDQLRSWGTLIQKQATLLNDDDGPGAAMSREDYKRQQHDLIKQSIPPDGMASEVWQHGMASFLIDSAKRGELHSVGAFKAAGVLDHLTDQQRAHVEAQIEKANRQVASKWEENNAATLADLEFRAANAETDRTARDIMAEAATMNRMMRQQTGSDGEVFTPDQVQALGRRSMQAIQQARVRRAMEEQAKATKYAADRQAAALLEFKKAQAADLVNTGNMHMAKYLGLKDSDVHMELINRIEDVKTATIRSVAPRLAGMTPEQAQGVLAEATGREEVALIYHEWKPVGYTVPAIVERYEQIGKTLMSQMDNGYDAGVMTGPTGAYTQWKRFYDMDPSGAFARKVWGPASDQFFEFHRARANGNDAAAFKQAFGRKLEGGLDDKEHKAVLSAVKSSMTSWLPAAWRGGDAQTLAPEEPGKPAVVVPRKIDVDAGTAALIANTVGPEAVRVAKQRAMSVDDVVPQLVKDMTQGDTPAMEPIGHYVIQNIGRAQPNAFLRAVAFSTYDGNPPPSDKIDEALNDFLHDRAKELVPKDAVISEAYAGWGGGRRIHNLEMYRGSSKKTNGQDDPTVSVFFTDNKGERYNTAFSASDLQAYIKKQGMKYSTKGDVKANSAFQPGMINVPHY